MRAATKHHLNVLLLVVLFLVSVIGAAISASFIHYTTSRFWGESVGPLYNDRTGKWYYSQGTTGHRYYHATGAILAGFILIWIASVLFLIANLSTIGRNENRLTGLGFECVSLLPAWTVLLVGVAVFTTDVRWQRCLSQQFCGLARATLGVAWGTVGLTLLAISCLIYLGRCHSAMDDRTGWNRSTLAGMQEAAEPLGTGKIDRLASDDGARPQGI